MRNILLVLITVFCLIAVSAAVIGVSEKSSFKGIWDALFKLTGRVDDLESRVQQLEGCACTTTTTTTIPCVEEGGSFPIVPPFPECCPGLESVGCSELSGDTCDLCTGASYCTACGDGVCGLGENVCRCPKDCTTTTTTTTTSSTTSTTTTLVCQTGDTIPCDIQVGVCNGAVKYCENGQYVECDYPSQNPDYQQDENLCDGKDNDCDAETDEGCFT